MTCLGRGGISPPVRADRKLVFDSFWGAGPTAKLIAGGMSARGEALVFLPKGTLSRLGAR